ncbi:hypothetical protein AB0L30_25445 [Microbispora rosea]|uniref:hypothetical protein n=1 Tax=Microbispora rosea TaxID=58117 RepID=UPI00342BEC52
MADYLAGDMPARVRPPGEVSFKPTRSAESSIEKVVAPTGSTRLRVEGGKLTFRGSTWSPLGPGLYQQNGGTQRLAPVIGTGGVAYVATDGPAYQHVPWWDTPPVSVVIVLLFAVTALSAVLRRRWSVAAIVTTVRAWRRAGALARGHQVVVLAGLLALLWFCLHWNLLGRHL